MSPEHHSVPEPGELVYAPRPSWAPPFFAFGAALALCGVFAGSSFMLPGWVYSLIGVVLVVAAFRSMVRGAVRGYLRLPRRQKARGAVLPVETVAPPSR